MKVEPKNYTPMQSPGGGGGFHQNSGGGSGNGKWMLAGGLGCGCLSLVAVIALGAIGFFMVAQKSDSSSATPTQVTEVSPEPQALSAPAGRPTDSAGVAEAIAYHISNDEMTLAHSYWLPEGIQGMPQAKFVQTFEPVKQLNRTGKWVLQGRYPGKPLSLAPLGLQKMATPRVIKYDHKPTMGVGQKHVLEITLVDRGEVFNIPDERGKWYAVGVFVRMK